MESIISELGAQERKILPLLKKTDDIKELVLKSGFEEIVVMRSLQWLSNKKLVDLKKIEHESLNLDSNGSLYVKKGLPEKRIASLIVKKSMSVSELEKQGLSKEEINACIGLLRQKSLANIQKDKELIFLATDKTKNYAEKDSDEEILLKKLPLQLSSLSEKEKNVVESLLKRKNMILKVKKIEWIPKLTDLGKKIPDNVLKEELLEKVTSEVIRNQEWKKKKFKKYDVQSNVPLIHPGRKHFVTETKEYVKSIWLELGFKEMKGNHVQSAFWNLDALFVPQDHPARELQDTFYVEGRAKIDSKLFERVKKVHENGGDTGSKGWQAEFSEEISSEILLRTHTTVLSALTLNKLKKEDLPKKFFSIGKNFRNEALDWKHLFEFHQVEGIVVDPDGNMLKLKSYLKDFFVKMGYSDVRIRPAHFPYTEPSAEVEAYNAEKKQWVEMGGAGIFRPEVTKTLLGFECPVLAWGLGLERIMSKYYDITDIRDIYKNDLEDLKKKKMFIK